MGCAQEKCKKIERADNGKEKKDEIYASNVETNAVCSVRKYATNVLMNISFKSIEMNEMFPRLVALWTENMNASTHKRKKQGHKKTASTRKHQKTGKKATPLAFLHIIRRQHSVVRPVENFFAPFFLWRKTERYTRNNTNKSSSSVISSFSPCVMPNLVIVFHMFVRKSNEIYW